MAERQTPLTPVHQDRRPGLSRSRNWTSSPMRTLQRMADEMDRMWEDFGFGHRPPSPLSRESADFWAPQIDAYQKNDELTIRADLPGLKREDVSVEINDDSVTIQGERKRETEHEHEGVYRSERSYGSFYRVVPLPEGAIAEQAKATFRDGVLEITMPAPPASRGRKLEIGEGTTKR